MIDQERWLSGRKRRIANPVSRVFLAPRVRIPLSPPSPLSCPSCRQRFFVGDCPMPATRRTGLAWSTLTLMLTIAGSWGVGGGTTRISPSLSPIRAAVSPPAETPRKSGSESGRPPMVSVTLTKAVDGADAVEGRVLVEAADGGLLLQTAAGRILSLTPDRFSRVEKLEQQFQPVDRAALASSLQAELGPGFQTHLTRHYVICSDASPAYVRWVGSLFERLQAGFRGYWKQAGLELTEPEFPLPVVLFRQQSDFVVYARQHGTAASVQSQGFYSITSNRIVLFDLVAAQGGPRAARNATEINQRLAAVQSNVATVVHEATHQIAFNMGVHVRLADNPVWLTEGLAMYFEPPDLRSRAGWRTIGTLNPFRLPLVRADLRSASPGELLRPIVVDNEAFREVEGIQQSYARAWSLVYFLVKTRRGQFVDYLAELQQRERLDWQQASERTAVFEKHFGPLEELEQDYLTFWQRQLR